MSAATVIFKAIDYMFDLQQNPIGRTKRNMKNVVKTTDIVYDESDKKACTLDTFVIPKEEGKYPVIFEIHGGGFVAGDKKYRRCLSAWYAQELGAFVVNVNYGLSPKYKFHQVIPQLVNAVNWVADHAEELRLDLSRFVVTGDSAGGYYSAYLAVLQSNPELQKRLGVEMKAKFTGTVLDCGIYDIVTALGQKVLFNLTDSICYDFVGVHTNEIEKYEYIDVVSPSSFVNSEFPVAFITLAAKDFFCGGQGEYLSKQLDDLGIYHEVYASTKFTDNHTFPLTWTSKAAKANNEQAITFLKRFVKVEI